MRIVAAMTREQALATGQTKATAMVNLAAATPEDDTAAGLFRKKSVALPGGRKVSPRTSSALEIEIESAAMAVRRAQATKKDGAGKRGLGRTTTEEERTLAGRAGGRPPLRAHPGGEGRSAEEGDRSGAENLHDWRTDSPVVMLFARGTER